MASWNFVLCEGQTIQSEYEKKSSKERNGKQSWCRNYRDNKGVVQKEAKTGNTEVFVTFESHVNRVKYFLLCCTRWF